MGQLYTVVLLSLTRCSNIVNIVISGIFINKTISITEKGLTTVGYAFCFVLVPGAPREVSCVDSSGSTITIEWKVPLEPNGQIQYYIIKVFSSSTSTPTFLFEVNSTSISTVVETLAQGMCI